MSGFWENVPSSAEIKIISHFKKNLNILQSEIHMFCIPEEESLNVSTLFLFCFCIF